MKETITLRQATLEDACRLLNWRNESGTRSSSHQQDKISLDEHKRWLQKILSNSARKLFIAEEFDDAIGTLRADLMDGVFELSWTIAPHCRGKGLAKRMVALLAQQISEPIRAEVKRENVASARIAEYVGMVFVREVEGVLHYQRGALNYRD